MCLIVFAYQCHPRYRLIMAANRDEFYKRPTRLAQFWEDNSGILAGQDIEAGGTWLGFNRNGRLAAVTNVRDGSQKTGLHSRGKLSTNFLRSDSNPKQYAQAITQSNDIYNGFNLLLADRHSMAYCSNRSNRIELLTPGIYSLSNHLLNTPWPKSLHAEDELGTLIQQDRINTEELITCLHRRDPFPDDQLPSTGINLEMERALSPPFIATPEYGTRCTSAILWSYDGRIDMTEQNYLPGGENGEKKEFSWQLTE